MRRIWPYLVLAGCYSDRALEIIVHDPDGLGVSHVELFVGRLATEQDVELPQVTTIQPAKGAYEEAVWWSRLHEGQDLETMKANQVRYQVFPSLEADAENLLASVIAVGFQKDPVTDEKIPLGVVAVLDKLEVPDEGRNRYDLDLQSFDSIGASSSKPGLRLWGGERGQSCVQVDRVPGLDAYGVKSAMVVRDGDLDCDTYGDGDANECFPDRYMAQAAIPRSSLACAYNRAFGADGTLSACVVGGATCADGTGRSPGVCSPTAYCMPTPACNTCSQVDPCDPHVPRPGRPFIECTLFHSPYTSGPVQFCPPSLAELELDTLFTGYGLQCDLGKAPKLRTSATSAWQDGVSLANAMVTLKIAPAPLPRGTHSCDFDVVGEGQLPVNLMTGEVLSEYGAMLSVPLSAPANGRGILMPLSVRVMEAVNGCTGAMLGGCKLVPTLAATDVPFEQCLRAPAAPDTIVLD